MRTLRFRSGVPLLLLTALFPVPVASQAGAGGGGAAAEAMAQQPAALTAEDYARAEGFLRQSTQPLVFGASVRPTWMEGDRFWYRNDVPGGTEFVLVDPARRTRERAFDHDRLADGLAAALGRPVEPLDLPFEAFAFAADGRAVTFVVGGPPTGPGAPRGSADEADPPGRRYTCDLGSYRCVDEGPEAGPDRNAILSPDGTRAAFIREHDLWLRDVATGEETRLTTDGVEDFGYATDNAGWVKSDRPVLVWSPDSKKIATFQHDARGVGEMYLVSTGVGHPTLEAWKYPLPEDSVVFRIHRVVIHVGEGTPRVVRLRMPPDVHRSTICDHVRCNGTWADVEWSPDGSRLAFVSSSRDHKEARLRIADPETGQVRDVMEERVETFFESGFNAVNWRVLHGSDEVLWYSQRDDWGHLYLFDLEDGSLKRQITRGPWNVLQVRRLDEDQRVLYATGAGREAGDPYFQYLYRIDVDRGEARLLTPDSANHSVELSPSGRYVLDSYSTPATPPVTVLREARDGRVVMTVQEADISRLVASGWQPPRSVTVKARDGVTDLWGLLYLPTDFDPGRTYPIINRVYPGPQTGSVGSRSFVPSRSDTQALAELGFVVVEIDAMGTPMRSKSFHTAYYGNMGDNGIPDQVAGMKQLAERYPWIDLDRAGIYGHSGGGFASTAAILDYPDFFKVAVSQAGNHDNRNYEDDWGEKWQGLLETYPDGSTSYDNQANQLRVQNLKGKLLLAHGTLDDNVPPSNTLVVVDALIAANKDFDLILFPNRRHGFGNEPYMMRRRWDYFVRHLMGVEPPAEFQFQGERRRPVS